MIIYKFDNFGQARSYFGACEISSVGSSDFISIIDDCEIQAKEEALSNHNNVVVGSSFVQPDEIFVCLRNPARVEHVFVCNAAEHRAFLSHSLMGRSPQEAGHFTSVRFYPAGSCAATWAAAGDPVNSGRICVAPVLRSLTGAGFGLPSKACRYGPGRPARAQKT